MGTDLAQARKIPWKSGAFSAAFVHSHGDAGFSPRGPEGPNISAADAAINGRSSTPYAVFWNSILDLRTRTSVRHRCERSRDTCLTLATS
jgi:hypothetical protein